MKTAFELLGTDDCNGRCAGPTRWCDADLEVVARRAREEAFEMAAQVAEEWCETGVADQIRALPTETTS